MAKTTLSPAARAALAARAAAPSAAPSGDGPKQTLRDMTTVETTRDGSTLTRTDRDNIRAALEVVTLIDLPERLAAIAAAIVIAPKTGPKLRPVDPGRVSVKTDGKKVRVNLPVAWQAAGMRRPGHVNVTITYAADDFVSTTLRDVAPFADLSRDA